MGKYLSEMELRKLTLSIHFVKEFRDHIFEILGGGMCRGQHIVLDRDNTDHCIADMILVQWRRR